MEGGGESKRVRELRAIKRAKESEGKGQGEWHHTRAVSASYASTKTHNILKYTKNHTCTYMYAMYVHAYIQTYSIQISINSTYQSFHDSAMNGIRNDFESSKQTRREPISTTIKNWIPMIPIPTDREPRAAGLTFDDDLTSSINYCGSGRIMVIILCSPSTMESIKKWK